MFFIVVGEVPSIGAIANEEELDEAKYCPSVAVASIGPVFDDLLHRLSRIDPERFQFNLDHG